MAELLEFRTVALYEVFLRVAFAGGFGLALGLERDWKNKPMDFRAFVIVAVTSCMIAIMAQEVYADYQSSDNTIRLDFMAIISGVLTGIGFLGAGAILRSDGGRVVGTATGASIWASGGIGLTLGFGFYVLSAISFVAIFGLLLVSGILMRRGDVNGGERGRRDGGPS
ncbi:MgtC/SapB family protein [Aquisalimonas lutea]|uniref:MgtC/SapB family protein n=1 Tax=Aquisalimonas lutea TaxID=1327750 RepID=UPI0025B51F22|nr:MgtC/SapB family protein [Aquisalimonas lutea]MDN3519473.1 MgtC/SapB family protein [Aquisalimonas lutea]